MNKILDTATDWLFNNEYQLLAHFSVNTDDIGDTETDGEVCQHTGDVTAWINYPVTGDMTHVQIIGGYDQLKKWFELNTPYTLNNVDINTEQKEIHICIDVG